MLLESDTSLSVKRSRGRPKKVRHEKPSIFRKKFSSDDIDSKSKQIANILKIAQSCFTDELAHIGFAYIPLRELCKCARMKHGCTNRPQLHRAVLMRDIAVVYAKYAKTSPISELIKINFSREQRAKNKKSKGIPSRQPAVEAATRAVLEALDEKYTWSLRRTAINTRRLLDSNLSP